MARYVTKHTIEISEKVKQIRIELGYERTEFAKKIDVSYNTLKNWENPELTNEPTASQYNEIQELYKKKGSTILASSQSVKLLIDTFRKLPKSYRKKLVALFQDSIGDE